MDVITTTISDYNVTEVNNNTISNLVGDVISNFSLANITDYVTINYNLTETIDNLIDDLNSTIANITNNTDNVTTAAPETTSSSSHYRSSFTMTIGVVVFPGTCAHALAAYCLAFDVKKKLSLVKQLLLLLCVIDILGLCSVTAHHAIISFLFDPPLVLCSFDSFLSGFLPLMSGALTSVMAVERCIKFCAPFWHSVNIWTWKVKVPIVLTTMLLMIVSLLPMSGLGYTMSQSGPRRCLILPTSVPRMYNSPEGIFTITYATVGLMTVLVDVSCNIAVMFTLVGMSGKRAEMSDSGEGKTAEMAMTRMLFWLSAAFLVTLSPLYLSLVVLYSGIPISMNVKTFTHALWGLHFTLDPFIYIFMMKTYRRRVKRLFCFCKKKPAVPTATVYELNTSNCTSHM